MMKNSKTQIDVEDIPSRPTMGPGERLQAARISVGMTLDDVANKMHLSTEILNSLEENNFDDITAPIFVKGYLRAYARLVSVNETEIIEQYTQYYTDGDPPISSIRNTMPEINADDARVKWTTYTVILVLITLLFMWWWNRYQQPAETVSLESETFSAPGVIKLPAQGSAASTDSIGLPASDTSTNENTDKEELVTQSEQEVLIPPLDAGLQSDSSDQMAEAEPQSAQQERDTTDNEPAMENRVESEAVFEPLPETDKDLMIIVNADTWADIRDANNNKLVYDLLRAGEIINVEGIKPYRAFFGNGYGVSLQFEGKEIDLSKNIQSNNTARIKIGQ